MSIRRHSVRLSANLLEDRLAPAAGELDATFGAGGIARFGAPPGAGATAAAGLLDGSVLVAGFSQQPGGNAFAVAKIRADGSPDPAFGLGGLATVSFPPATLPGISEPFRDSSASAIAVGPDGRIVLAGDVPGSGFGVARFNPDGTPDTSFGTNGALTLQFGQFCNASAVTVQPDGRIVLAGSALTGEAGGFDFLAARLSPDGSLDPTFGGDGWQAIPFDQGTWKEDFARGVAIQPDGRIVLAGEAGVTAAVFSGAQAERDFALARLNPDGSPDPTFDGDGKLAFSLRPDDSAAAVALLPDGRILVAGTTGSSQFLHGLGGADLDFVVLRLHSDGSSDPSFGTEGRTVIPVPDQSPALAGNVNRLTALAVQSTGNIVVAGYGLGQTAAARLNPNGTPDSTFGTAGLVLHPLDLASGALAAVAAPLGRIVLAGTARDSANPLLPPSMAVVRLQGDPIGPAPVLVGGRPDGTATIFSFAGVGTQAIDALAYFPGFAGTVRTATADVTGDGVPDFVGGAGPGGGPSVVVIDGRTGARVADWYAFEPSFTGGVFVAAADIDGDGKAEVVVTPDESGGPIVAIYRGSRLATGVGGQDAQLARFFGIAGDPSFRGGCRPALGDLNGDGAADLVVSAGVLGGPRIAIFDGQSLKSASGDPGRLVGDFFAFESTLRNGAFVAAGDVTGDGRADVAFGGGPGGAPRVRLFDGKSLLSAPAFGNVDEVAGTAQRANFFAGDTGLRGGVRLALRDADGDGKAELLTGSGAGEPSRVRVFPAATLLSPDPVANQEIDPFGAMLANGVFVG